jgi:prevent-host-death family protein
MIALSVAEAKNSLSAILARVEAGEEFEITRRGRPVAVLKAANKQSRDEVFARMDAFRRALAMPPLTDEEIKAAAREGTR